MELKFKKIDPDAKLPEYAKPGDAGMDLVTLGQYTVAPGTQRAMRTGLAVEIPEGYVGLVCSRSGMATKGAVVANAPGVIDSGYRGEIKVIIANINSHSAGAFRCHPGDRVAQLVIVPFVTATPVEVEELSDTERGEGGLGSTGMTVTPLPNADETGFPAVVTFPNGVGIMGAHHEGDWLGDAASDITLVDTYTYPDADVEAAKQIVILDDVSPEVPEPIAFTAAEWDEPAEPVVPTATLAKPAKKPRRKG